MPAERLRFWRGTGVGFILESFSTINAGKSRYGNRPIPVRSGPVDRIIWNVDRDVPILVHSVNTSQGWVMAVRLWKQGFEVTHIPMSLPTAQAYAEWMCEVAKGGTKNE